MFPLPFPYLRALIEPDETQLNNAGFLVGAMMTPDYADLGERLLKSCQDFSLPVAIFEVPTVHCSISQKGTENLSYTKANFIHFLIDRYKKPILYVDADCVVMQYPDRIELLLEDQVDFAIFNWFAEEDTAGFIPVDVTIKDDAGTRVVRDRFFQFAISQDVFSESQLVCSGATQLYNNTPAAKQLLTSWQAVIESSPHSQDDQCLDFAFNNRPEIISHVKTAWLDKSYARIAWWIYTKPVINHPEFPIKSGPAVNLDKIGEKSRFYLADVEKRSPPQVFPRDCLIDSTEKVLLRSQGKHFIQVGSFSTELWL